MTGKTEATRVVRVALAAACLAAAPSPVRAALPDDLRLDLYPEIELRADPEPNPHSSFPCERCHVGTESSYEVARRYRVAMPLVTEGDNPILLCESCHPGDHGAHPGNVRVGRLGPAIEAAGVFPLLQLVEGYERITCTSCHAVHFPHTASALLRGFPVDRRTDGAPFRTRLDFCVACHGAEAVRLLSGHGTRDGDAGCALCHGPRDIAGHVGDLRPDLNATCSLCHPATPGKTRHFYRFNPFPEIGREDLPAYGVVLDGGRFTCATCHLHHAEGAPPSALAEGFVAVAGRSTRINPHETRQLCIVCHPVNPGPIGSGGPAPLAEEDRTRLCRRCHARDGALRMQHPLAAGDGRAVVAEGWPLRDDGTLGCETCHLPGHPPPDPGNPRFLRGGPYAERNAVCFRCHRRGEYTGRNPHAAAGREDECALCHEITGRSAVNPAGKAGPLLAEPNLLCLRCHSPPRHPAASEHTVLLRARSFLAVDRERIPITLGKVTCHSCHDSHAAAGGDLLRAEGPGFLCAACHPF